MDTDDNSLSGQSSNKTVKEIERLNEKDDLSKISSLIEALSDENEPVRLKATFALGKIKDKEVLQLLTAKALDKNENKNVRFYVILAIGHIADMSSLPVIVETLNDYEAEVRRASVLALYNFGVSSIPYLTMALTDKDFETRQNAAFNLGNLKAKEATLPLLEIALNVEEIPIVRGNAILAISRLGEPLIIEKLFRLVESNQKQVRFYLALVLGELGSEVSIKLLTKLAYDIDQEVRWRAVSSLAKVGNIQMLDELAKIQKNDKGKTINGSVSSAAKKAIKQILQRESKPPK